MAMAYYCRISGSKGQAMSAFKLATPKIITAMKEIAVRFEKMFGEKYTVQRFIATPKGMKKV